MKEKKEKIFNCEYTNKRVIKTYIKSFITGTSHFSITDINCDNSNCTNFRNCPYDKEIQKRG